METNFLDMLPSVPQPRPNEMPHAPEPPASTRYTQVSHTLSAFYIISKYPSFSTATHCLIVQLRVGFFVWLWVAWLGDVLVSCEFCGC